MRCPLRHVLLECYAATTKGRRTELGEHTMLLEGDTIMAAIVIRRGDLEIEIQDVADLQIALEALGEGQALPARDGGPDASSSAPNVRAVVPSEEQFRRFYEGLRGKYGMGFVKALYRSPNGLSDAQLRRELGLSSNLMLAGISAGIAKSERRAGLPGQAAVKRERKGGVGDYSYKYLLTRECRQALAPMIGMVPSEAPKQNDGASG